MGGWAGMSKMATGNTAMTGTGYPYGLNATTGSISGLAGGAAGAGIGALLGNPLIGMILSQVGGSLLEKFFGGGPTPYEQFQKQSMGALQQQLPIIQAQAAGKPSAATQAQLAALRQQTTRAQQSYGSTALGRNVGQTTPTKATQQRFRVAETQAAGEIMGNAQLAAQQQLMQLGMGGAAGMRDIEMREAESRKGFYNDLAYIMGTYRNSQQDPNLDLATKAAYAEAVGFVKDLMMQMKAEMFRK